MADRDEVVGFSRPDAEALLLTIGGSQVITPRRLPSGSRGGVRAIQGTLTALTTATTGYYTGKKVGTITVVVAPCSDSDLIGDSVSVVDWSGCVFDRDFADLEDVWVWASEGIAASLDEEADTGDLTPCHWTANDRCCVAADGGA